MILTKINQRLNKWFCWVGGASIIAMTGLACANILLRPFGHPWKGTYEIVGFLGALVFAFALGYSQITNSHIKVDIMNSFYSSRTKRIIKGIGNFISIIFFGFLAWRIYLYAAFIIKTGEKSDTLMIIFYPFIYALAICFTFFAFVIFVDFVSLVASDRDTNK